ncbi:hypothetical protein DN748_07320 [Sinomicrobium soli]|nr:hypothetical protein DN748_07320 [Sinomicrobium sp. N-1-3-6]
MLISYYSVFIQQNYRSPKTVPVCPTRHTGPVQVGFKDIEITTNAGKITIFICRAPPPARIKTAEPTVIKNSISLKNNNLMAEKGEYDLYLRPCFFPERENTVV